jgi:hypothetical protein
VAVFFFHSAEHDSSAGSRQTAAVTDALPIPRTMLRTSYVRVLVFCNSCRHQADADLQAIADAGRGGAAQARRVRSTTPRPARPIASTASDAGSGIALTALTVKDQLKVGITCSNDG